jgi:hypothetical protein
VCVCRGGPPSTETVKTVSWPPVEPALGLEVGPARGQSLIGGQGVSAW